MMEPRYANTVIGAIQSTNSYTWTITNFLSIPKNVGEAIQSPTFATNVDNIISKWQLLLYPNGKKVDCENFLCFYIRSMEVTHLDASIKFTVMDSENQAIFKKIRPDAKFRKISDYWGFIARSKTLSDLVKTMNAANDKLTIVCEINCDNVVRKELRLKEFDEFEQLLENKTFSDVVFKVDGKQFHAHKNILAQRSPVFAAMFKHEMMEAMCSTVEIEDISPEVFREMLRFIYAGKVKEIKRIDVHLLAAADKYFLKGLKLMCETSLCNNLTTDNALRYLHLADTHNALALRARALKFVTSHAVDIVDKPELRLLHRDIFCEILRAVVHKKT